MTTYDLYLKIVVTVSMRDIITVTQVRAFLADGRSKLDARLATLVNNAPSGAQAVLNGTDYKLKAHKSTPTLWEIYPKIVVTITVADGITLDQVQTYLEGYWDQFKTDFRALVATAPPQANAQIVEWHVHRLTGAVNEVE